ncbi:MAG: hypothetical protein H6835_05495 [Planctomycetes bacterium]|nr:hypothetical protein [Planctomycetota bacterium]
MRRTVFVAGRGAVSGFGLGLCALVDAVFAGESALRERRRTAAYEAPTAVVGELPPDVLPGVAENDVPLRAALLAADEALEEAGQPDRRRLGVIYATTKADMSGICGDGRGLGSPQRLALQLAAALGSELWPASVSCACASGVQGVAAAARRIAAGEWDRAIVLASDVINEFILRGFGGMGALDPERCRPFDESRRGVSLGDGAGAIVLSCAERDSIGVRVSGWAGANDACHVTGPDYEGLGVGLAARRAVAHAGLAMADVDLLHLHATGTRANDKTEAIGLGNAFTSGTALERTPPAFGSKSQTGHTLGAAGVLESLLAIAALQRATVPANVGLTTSDCDPRLDLPTSPRALRRSKHALKVASGFGGVQGAAVYSS